MKVLLFNAGSSSLKAVLRESRSGELLASCLADWAGSATRYRYTALGAADRSDEVAWSGHAQAVRQFTHDLTCTAPIAVQQLAEITAVGHRIVHGGPFTQSVLITPHIRSQIAALADLAPLHNPPS